MYDVGQPVPPILSSADESIKERKPLQSILLSRSAALIEEPEDKLGGGERDLVEVLSKVTSSNFVASSLSSFKEFGLSTSADDSEASSQWNKQETKNIYAMYASHSDQFEIAWTLLLNLCILQTLGCYIFCCDIM